MRLTTSVFLLSILTSFAYSQDTINIYNKISNPNVSYEQAAVAIEALVDSNYLDSTGIEGMTKHLLHWKKFWGESLGSSYTPFSGLQVLSTELSQSYGCQSGVQWTPKGPMDNPKVNSNPDRGGNLGRVSAVASFEGSNGFETFYAGIAYSGVFKSTDGGSTWSNITDQLGRIGISVNKIELSPVNPDIIICGLGVLGFAMSSYTNAYSQQLIRSTDGGNSWSQISLRTISGTSTGYGFVGDVAFDPSSPSTVYATCDEKLYKSTNSGANWNEVGFTSGPSIGLRRGDDIEIDPNTGHLWIAYNDRDLNLGGALLVEVIPSNTNPYQATAIDRTPSQISGNYGVAKVEYSADSPNEIFTAYVGKGKVTVIHQNKNSSTSTKQYDYVDNSFIPDKFEFLVSSSDHEIMYLGGTEMYKSTDGFATRNDVHDVHDDIRSLELLKEGTTSNNDDEVILIGHDGGISITETGFEMQNGTGPRTSLLNGYGLNITEIWHAQASDNAGSYLIGCHDNGTLRYTEQSGWDRRIGGDGGAITPDPDNPGYFYGVGNNGLNKGVMTRTTNYGETWSRIGPSLFGLGEESFIKCYSGGKVLYPSRSPRLDDLILYDFGTGTNTTLITQSGTMRLWGDLIDYEYLNGKGYLAVSWPENNSLSQTSIIRIEHTGPSFVPTNWDNITPGLMADKVNPITDIEMSANENSIWVSFGGFNKDSQGNKEKVYLGVWDHINSVMVWSNHSFDLPNVPVRALKVVPGTNILYAASDAGVFWKTFTGTSWYCHSKGLPRTVINSLSIDPCSNELIAATFGRGLWTSKLVAGVQPNTEEYWSNATISSSNESILDVWVVKSGATLTIAGTAQNPITLNFAASAGIIVEPGGKLEIEYATLTNGCNSLWYGIQVQGDPSMTQTHSSTQHQGVVEISNSTLENSRNGITAGLDPDHLNYKSISGGIINANNVIFRNNHRSICFGRYQNVDNNGKPFRNASSIVNCNFVSNDSYHYHSRTELLADQNQAPKYDPVHVKFYGVDGVTFNQNEFENSTTGIQLKHFSKGRAINLVNSNIDVNNCEFTNLGNAIEVLSVNGISSANVRDNNFTGCYLGVYLRGTQLAQVHSNIFTNSGNAGVFVEESVNYEVTQNEFNGGDKIGVIVKSNQFTGERVYNNDFDGVSEGVHSEDGSNAFNSSFKMRNLGLEIKCNDFEDNKISGADISVTSGSIRYYQGKCFDNIPSRKDVSPAGNEFSHTCANGAKDIYMDLQNSTGVINYSHHNQIGTGPHKPDCNQAKFSAMNNCQTAKGAASCPSAPAVTQSGVSSTLSSKLSTARVNYYTQKGNWQDAVNSLNGLIDGGNTQNLLNLIADPNLSSSDLYLDLNSASPYLSDEVVIAAIDRNPSMDSDDLLNVLLANSPLSLAVQDLIPGLSSQLSQSEMDQLEDAQDDGVSDRFEEEQLVVYEYSLTEIALGELLRIFAHDTLVEDPLDSLLFYYGDWDSPSSRMCAIQIHWKQENFTDAEILIDSLKGDSIHSNLGWVLQKIHDYTSEDDSLYKIWNDSILIDSIAQDTSRVGFALARNINSIFHEYYSTQPESLTITGGGGNPPSAPPSNDPTQSVETKKRSGIAVFPNPVSDLLTFTWNDMPKAESFLVQLKDISGRAVYSRAFQSQQGKRLIDLSNLKSGSYLFVVTSSGSLLHIEKLVVNE